MVCIQPSGVVLAQVPAPLYKAVHHDKPCAGVRSLEQGLMGVGTLVIKLAAKSTALNQLLAGVFQCHSGTHCQISHNQIFPPQFDLAPNAPPLPHPVQVLTAAFRKEFVELSHISRIGLCNKLMCRLLQGPQVLWSYADTISHPSAVCCCAMMGLAHPVQLSQSLQLVFIDVDNAAVPREDACLPWTISRNSNLVRSCLLSPGKSRFIAILGRFRLEKNSSGRGWPGD